MTIAFDLTSEGIQIGQDPLAASPLLSTKQAAIYLGLSNSTLNKWRCYGTGPSFVKLGRAVRYRKAQLDEFLATRTAVNTIY